MLVLACGPSEGSVGYVSTLSSIVLYSCWDLNFETQPATHGKNPCMMCHVACMQLTLKFHYKSYLLLCLALLSYDIHKI